jgi:L-threonylcarbamoyladenylate synthase
MKTIQVTAHNLVQAADEAAEVLRQGRVVVYPTDTAYGFAVHGLLPATIEKIFRLKGRRQNNPIHLVVRDLAAVETITEMSPCQRAVLAHWLPGQLTFVLTRKPIVPESLVAGGSTIGIRIPRHPVTQELSRRLDFPYTATSANVSGQPAVYSIAALREQFPENAEIALILNYGDLATGAISTVIDIVAWPEYRIVREGAVSAAKFAEWAARITETK